MKRKFLLLFAALTTFASQLVSAQNTIVKYLSGTDKDHTVSWEFFCTDGAKSGAWTTIPVPSNWELQGFGGYNYGHEKNKHQEHGLYKYHFTADKTWSHKKTELVFEGVMTDAQVKVNGQLAGEVHRGSFYRFSYDITNLLKYGADNLLELDVSKMSADSTVNKAEREGDFWVLGGIYRPVYLKIEPDTHISRVAINAKADGHFSADIFTEGLKPGDEIRVFLKPLGAKGRDSAAASIVYKVTGTSDQNSINTQVASPRLWSPEFPALYQADVLIYRNQKRIHAIQQKFGFRTVEVRKGDGIYVNNKKTLFKGVNRHSFWPESGRTLSRSVHLLDIGLIKDMNMNAVRMSHYPPDPEFLDLCDSLGLFVLDELTGWQKKYGTPVGRKLVKELVTRDVNHPSVIFWDNGNEGGFNTDLDNDYALYDPQKRTVLHPWELFNNVDTKHYPDYSYIEKAADKNNILLHTEMIHGLYDGGHGAGLEDYWNLMQKNPRHAGGFLWVLFDEGVVRKDRHDSIDTYGNNAPDGITGPHREKEGSYYTIKEIWSPVQVEKPVLDNGFTGKLTINNQYDFTNLSDCRFQWQLIQFAGSKSNSTGHTVLSSGKSNITLAPGEKGSLSLALPANWHSADALQLIVNEKNGHEIARWTWTIRAPADINASNMVMAPARSVIKGIIDGIWYDAGRSTGIVLVDNVNHLSGRTDSVTTALIKTGKKTEHLYSVWQNETRYDFDTTTGLLTGIIIDNRSTLPINGGPVLAGDKQVLQSFRHYRLNDQLIIEANYTGRESLHITWTFSPGVAVKLDYSYTQKEAADFAGITFQLDETKITGMKWLGGGPFRVWKNRLKGATIDVWEKKYNNTITGETFDYPEFKGYHSDLYWATIENTVSPFTVFTDKPGVYLQILHPGKQKTKFNPFVNPAFPEGDLGFMSAIPPIGTKFREAASMGPQSQKNPPVNGYTKGTIWFRFNHAMR